ncbi:hypothetical protein [Limosilactobacillus equigenerosi]|nr:hypothetical protein [Limosilactobacillus equigenerosi]
MEESYERTQPDDALRSIVASFKVTELSLESLYQLSETKVK